jgi:hypothetical protein
MLRVVRAELLAAFVELVPVVFGLLSGRNSGASGASMSNILADVAMNAKEANRSTELKARNI